MANIFYIPSSQGEEQDESGDLFSSLNALNRRKCDEESEVLDMQGPINNNNNSCVKILTISKTSTGETSGGDGSNQQTGQGSMPPPQGQGPSSGGGGGGEGGAGGNAPGGAGGSGGGGNNDGDDESDDDPEDSPDDGSHHEPSSGSTSSSLPDLVSASYKKSQSPRPSPGKASAPKRPKPLTSESEPEVVTSASIESDGSCLGSIHDQPTDVVTDSESQSQTVGPPHILVSDTVDEEEEEIPPTPDVYGSPIQVPETQADEERFTQSEEDKDLSTLSSCSITSQETGNNTNSLQWQSGTVCSDRRVSKSCSPSESKSPEGVSETYQPTPSASSLHQYQSQGAESWHLAMTATCETQGEGLERSQGSQEGDSQEPPSPGFSLHMSPSQKAPSPAPAETSSPKPARKTLTMKLGDDSDDEESEKSLEIKIQIPELSEEQDPLPQETSIFKPASIQREKSKDSIESRSTDPFELPPELRKRRDKRGKKTDKKSEISPSPSADTGPSDAKLEENNAPVDTEGTQIYSYNGSIFSVQGNLPMPPPAADDEPVPGTSNEGLEPTLRDDNGHLGEPVDPYEFHLSQSQTERNEFTKTKMRQRAEERRKTNLNRSSSDELPSQDSSSEEVTQRVVIESVNKRGKILSRKIIKDKLKFQKSGTNGDSPHSSMSSLEQHISSLTSGELADISSWSSSHSSKTTSLEISPKTSLPSLPEHPEPTHSSLKSLSTQTPAPISLSPVTPVSSPPKRTLATAITPIIASPRSTCTPTATGQQDSQFRKPYQLTKSGTSSASSGQSDNLFNPLEVSSIHADPNCEVICTCPCSCCRKRSTCMHDESPELDPGPAKKRKKQKEEEKKSMCPFEEEGNDEVSPEIPSMDTPQTPSTSVPPTPSTSTTPAPAIPSTSAAQLSPTNTGTRVLAKWADKCYYPGNMIYRENNGKFFIQFEDDDCALIREKDIIFTPLQCGQHCLVGNRQDNDDVEYVPGMIVDVHEHEGSVSYDVSLDSGEGLQVPRSMVILKPDHVKNLVKQEGKIPEPMLKPKPQNKSALDLDNILGGKRRRSADVRKEQTSSDTPSTPASSRKGRPRKTPATKTPKVTRARSARKRSRSPSVAEESPTLTPAAPKSSKRSKKEKQEATTSHDTSPKPSTQKKGGKRTAKKNVDVPDSGKKPAFYTSTPTPQRVKKTGIREEAPVNKQKQTVIEESETAVRRSPRKSKPVKQDIFNVKGKIPPAGSRIFFKCAFLITLGQEPTDSDDTNQDDMPPFDKQHIRTQIANGGGIVLTSFNHEAIQLAAECYLIAPTYRRTIKYFQCLAADITCLSHLWIRDSCNQGEKLPTAGYVLQAGFSYRLEETVERRIGSRPLSGLKVHIAADDEFRITWTSVLDLAGCKVIQKFSVKEEKPTVIITDEKCPPSTVKRAKDLSVPLVSSEWLIQSLINSMPLPYDEDPRFNHEYHATLPST